MQSNRDLALGRRRFLTLNKPSNARCRLDPFIAEYTTDAALFSSGSKTADYGLKDLHRRLESLRAMRNLTTKEPNTT